MNQDTEITCPKCQSPCKAWTWHAVTETSCESCPEEDGIQCPFCSAFFVADGDPMASDLHRGLTTGRWTEPTNRPRITG